MIIIVDYGMGNIASILNMYKRIGITNIKLSSTLSEIENATKIILPGVGSFDTGMTNLKQSNLIEPLTYLAKDKKIPFLGICLGMQLLTNKSEEGVESGLGFIDAETKKFKFADTTIKIPHMGWNYVKIKRENQLYVIDERPKFYFVHSYYVHANESENIIGTCEYGMEFTCMINKENIFGVQFHPEKSHKFGMKLLENFAKI